MQEKTMTEDMGGEVADFIRKVKGKYIHCYGTCWSDVQCNDIRGYPHEGGLADATGQKWWVYVHCTNPKDVKGNECGYDISFSKVEGQVDRQTNDLLEVSWIAKGQASSPDMDSLTHLARNSKGSVLCGSTTVLPEDKPIFRKFRDTDIEALIDREKELRAGTIVKHFCLKCLSKAKKMGVQKCQQY